MIAFEQQRISTAQKDEQWRKNMVDAVCSRTDEFGSEWYRMWQNYRMKNNQIDQDEFREYCDTLGLDRAEGRKFVEPFNQIHLIIDVLKGEEESIPWNFNVVNISPNATNEIIRMKEREIMAYVDFRISTEIEKQQANIAIMEQMSQGQMTPEQAQQESDNVVKRIKKMEETVLNPEQIEKKYKKYKSIKEIAAHKILTSLVINHNLKWVKNQTFEDALIAGVEAVEVTTEPASGLPVVKQINPLNLFWHKSADTPFIQDSDYVGYKEEMTVSDVIDRFGDDLPEDQLQRLKQYNSKVFGLDAKFHSKDGESPSHWDNIKNYEYTYRHPYSTIPSYGTSNVISDGLYASDRYRYRYENFCVVYTAYWRSQRRVGKLGFINDDGELEYTFVSEDYKIPKRAKKTSYKPHTFSRTKYKYEWEDARGYKSIEWLWIPEIWKGVRINGDIYAKIEPYQDAYQSLLNPYKVKIPIHGFIYNNRNAYSLSIVDRAKPWQKLYYIVMSRWLKLITQDKGVIQLLNVLMMDKKLGYEKSLQLAVDQGVLPYNPLAHTQGAALATSNTPAAQRLDLSNTEQIARYTQMLEFIENQLQMSAGITKPRLAQTSSNTNVSDNQRDVAQSMNITSSVFNNHHLLWQEVLQTMMEVSVKALSDKKGIIRQILSDEELALIDVGLIDMDDEFVVKIINNSKNTRLLMEAKALAQALVQNDKAKFSTLLDLIGTENLTEFKEQLREIEMDIEKREEMLQQQQQEHEKEMMQMQQQAEDVKHKRLLEVEKLKGDYKLEAEKISAMSWYEDKDLNDNSVPDVLELATLKEDIKKNEHEMKMHERDLDLRQQEIDAKRQKIESDRLTAVDQMKTSLEIAKEKAKQQAKKQSTKPKK